MAKLPVKPLAILGNALTPSGNIAVVGSLAAGAPAFSGDPATIQSLPAWAQGLLGTLINTGGGKASPALEDFAGIFYVITYMLAYIKQAGLCEWDTTVAYYNGSWANVAGVPYISQTDNNVGNNPATDTVNWFLAAKALGTTTGAAKAWVVFDGTTNPPTIKSSFNVGAVSKTAAGCYVISFTNALANAEYAPLGSAGTPNGTAPINGDDNHIAFGALGKTIVKTIGQLSAFCISADSQHIEDSQRISIVVFATP